MPGSMTIFFLPHQMVFLCPGKRADLSLTRKMHAKSRSMATAVSAGTKPRQGQGGGSAFRLIKAGMQIRWPDFPSEEMFKAKDSACFLLTEQCRAMFTGTERDREKTEAQRDGETDPERPRERDRHAHRAGRCSWMGFR